MTLRILVVDDDALLRFALRAALEDALGDVDVVVADGAARAQAMLATTMFDLVVTDVVMEHADAGWELAVRARSLGIPVVLLSANKNAASLGRPLNVPLFTKSELARLEIGGIVRSAIASQRGIVE